jgi:small subunit ribosomal protein S1
MPAVDDNENQQLAEAETSPPSGAPATDAALPEPPPTAVSEESPALLSTAEAEPPPPGPATADHGPRIAAVDTGRRIDPQALRAGSTIRRGEKPGDRAHDRGGAKGRSGRREPEIIRKGQPMPRTEEGVAEAPTIEGAPASDATTVEKPMVTGEAERGARAARGEPDARGARGDRNERRGPRRDRGERGERGGDRPRGPRPPQHDFSDLAPIVVPRDENEDIGDFAAMLAETGPIDRVDVRVGDKVRATCVHIGSETVFFQLSRTQEAQVNLAELLDDEGTLKIALGDEIDAFVVGLSEGIQLSTKLGKDQIDVGMLEQARVAQMPVQGTVSGVNKGGLEVTLAGAARGFCPIGQADINFVDDPQSLMGKTLSFLVRDVKENGRNIVLSRKALLEKERKEQAQKLLATLAVGQQVKGTVTRIQPFGAFADLGGIDGLIPISELGWGHVKDPGEVLKVGDQVTVEVRRIEPDEKRKGQLRISLSLKAAQPDPFLAHLDALHPGAMLVGTVKKLETFGAFIELWPGVQGLAHISEIADRRIGHPRDVLNVDEEVQVRVLDADPGTRRISLSLKEAPAALDEPGPGEERADRASRADRPRGPRIGRGTQVEGVVDRIERYGVFLKLDPVDGKELGSAFLPASETGTPRGSDLGKALPLGTRLQVLVIEVDDRGRLKVSKTAREQAEERALVEQYKSDKKGGGGLGTLGDLLKQKLGK